MALTARINRATVRRIAYTARVERNRVKAVMKVAPGVGNVAVCDIEEPHAQAGQVKIRVEAAGICGTDLHIYKDEFRSWPPVVLGHEIAGEIAEIGADVSGIEPGARVTTETYFSYCGECRYCRSGQTNLCLDRRSIGSAGRGRVDAIRGRPAAAQTAAAAHPRRPRGE